MQIGNPAGSSSHGPAGYFFAHGEWGSISSGKAMSLAVDCRRFTLRSQIKADADKFAKLPLTFTPGTKNAISKAMGEMQMVMSVP